MLFTQGKKLPEVLQNSTCSLDTDTHIHKGLEKCLFRNSLPPPYFFVVLFFRLVIKKENTSFLCVGFGVLLLIFLPFLYFFFFYAKGAGREHEDV